MSKMKKSYLFIFSVLMAMMIGLVPALSYSQDTEATEEGEKTEKLTRKEKSRSFDPFLYINLHAGASLNHSDMSNQRFAPPTNEWKLGLGGSFGWQFHNIWGLRFRVDHANLFGTIDEEWLLQDYFIRVHAGEEDDLAGFKGDGRYEATVTEANVDFTINLSNLISGYNEDRTIDFFAIGGIGNVQWRTRSWEQVTGDRLLGQNGWGDGSDINEVDGEGTEKGMDGRTRTMVYTAGLGAMAHIAPKWDITLETDLKFVDSDRLDTWPKGAMAVKKDMYSLTSLGVTFKMFYSDPLKKMEKNYETVTYIEDPDPLENHGQKVKVHVVATFPEKYFHPKAAMEFTPVLEYEGGSVALKTVYLKGQDVAGEGIVVPYEGGSISYDDEVDYVEGMMVSELNVTPTIFLPKEAMEQEMTKEQIESNKYIVLPVRKLADGVTTTPLLLAHNENNLVAYHGYEKETILTETATIFFLVNRHNLNWKVPLNKEDDAKAKLQGLNDFLALGYDIKDINFDGWASPEGEETFNAGLSQNRSKETNSHMIKEIKKLMKAEDSKLKIEDAEADVTYNVNSHGPDWNGFLSNVQGSDMADKNIIQNVINSAGTPAKKEQEIRNMIVIYPEREEKILPSLRRADIVVNLYQPKKSEADILAMATASPRDLDDKELLYAATLTDDNDEKLRIYKNHINVYPDDYRGYVNAASIEIEQGDLVAAKGHLETAQSLEPNSGEVFNNVGIVYAMEGDFDKAEENFNKARDLGEDENYNLGIVNIYKGDYDRAIALFGDATCDYNVALAYILKKDYAPAEQQLNCAPKNAASYYLTAILGSRTDNTALMYENLTNAVQEDASLKAYAARDREFIKYFNEPDFQAITQ